MQQISKLKSVGIIGGGVSGLSAAYFLKKQIPNLDVTVFQSTAKMGGRANTFVKYHEEKDKKFQLNFDHGACYFTQDDSSQKEFLQNHLFQDKAFLEGLEPIKRPLYLLDKDDKISKSDRKQHKKFTYQKGIRELSEIFVRNIGDTKLQYDTKVLSVDKLQSNKWQVNCEVKKNAQNFEFDQLIFAIHPFSLQKIIKNSNQNVNDEFKHVLPILQDVKFRSIANISIGYKIPTEYQNLYPFQDFFALLNTDRSNDISWISFENDKKGHMANEQQFLGISAQMSPQWTQQNWELGYDDCVNTVKEKLKNIFGKEENMKHLKKNNFLHEVIAQPNHIFQLVRKWEYALHDTHVQDTKDFDALSQQNVFFCGDYFFEKARVTNAMISGQQAANRIAQQYIKQKI